MRISRDARAYAAAAAPNDADLWNNARAQELAAAAFEAGMQHERRRVKQIEKLASNGTPRVPAESQP